MCPTSEMAVVLWLVKKLKPSAYLALAMHDRMGNPTAGLGKAIFIFWKEHK